MTDIKKASRNFRDADFLSEISDHVAEVALGGYIDDIVGLKFFYFIAVEAVIPHRDIIADATSVLEHIIERCRSCRDGLASSADPGCRFKHFRRCSPMLHEQMIVSGKLLGVSVKV